jgi:predicted AAA+ superfamily ATPase
LLGIKTLTALKSNSLYGSIFENWVITEIKKNNFNNGINGGLYYFRDSLGNEVDLVLEKGDLPIGIEIKSSTKFNTEMLRGLKYWQKQQPKSNSILFYAGKSQSVINDTMTVLPWKDIVDV